MNILSVILFLEGLFGGGGEGKEGSNPYMMLIMMGVLVVVFYFFMIRPQMKKQKELKQFRSELKEGDKVVTVGGMYGKITKIKDTTVILEIESGDARIKVDKNGLVKDSADIGPTAKK